MLNKDRIEKVLRCLALKTTQLDNIIREHKPGRDLQSISIVSKARGEGLKCLQKIQQLLNQKKGNKNGINFKY